MTAKIDGTNGLIQQYDYQTPTTGFSYTFAAGTQTLVMNPAGTLATGTITMPSAPADGMTITFSSIQQITALTLNGNTGQSVSSAVTFLPAKTTASYVYRIANTTWYPVITVPGTGSQLVQGTANNSLSGTSIDFTGIPAWAKRITVMFNSVSVSGTSNIQIQVGAGSIATTGYFSQSSGVGTGTGTASSTTGLLVTQGSAATDGHTGAVQLFLQNSTNWVSSGTISRYNTAVIVSAGLYTISGALDRVRITTVNGTDTFDLGSINILYE